MIWIFILIVVFSIIWQMRETYKQDLRMLDLQDALKEELSKRPQNYFIKQNKVEVVIQHDREVYFE